MRFVSEWLSIHDRADAIVAGSEPKPTARPVEIQVADTTGARRAIEWFLGNSPQEPSDTDLLDLHCFLRNLMAQIDAGDELSLAEWESIHSRPAIGRHALN